MCPELGLSWAVTESHSSAIVVRRKSMEKRRHFKAKLYGIDTAAFFWKMKAHSRVHRLGIYVVCTCSSSSATLARSFCPSPLEKQRKSCKYKVSCLIR